MKLEVLKKLEDWQLYIIVAVVMFVLGVWILPTIKNEIRDAQQEDPEWCLVEELPPAGGSWNQQNAGHYEYQVITTEAGFKVFQRCGKIE